MENPQPLALEANDLGRDFGPHVTAVDRLSIHARPGEVIAIVGPVGSGKTTTWSMLTGMIRPTRGSVKLLGEPLDIQNSAVKMRLGIVPDRSVLFESLTGRELLHSYARIYGLSHEEADERIPPLVRRFRLEHVETRPLTTWSLAQKKMLRIAAALTHRPDLVIIDDLFDGMDELGALSVMQTLRGRAERRNTATVFTARSLTGTKAHFPDAMIHLVDRPPLRVAATG